MLYDLRDSTGNISSIMTKHMGYIVGYTALFISLAKVFNVINHDLLVPLYFSSLSSAPEINTGNIAPTETTSEAYWCVFLFCSLYIEYGTAVNEAEHKAKFGLSKDTMYFLVVCF